MEITVNWRRTEYYTSTITLDDDEVQAFANLAEEADGKPVEITAEVVKEFLESNDAADYLEANDNDWVHADDTVVDEVTLA